MASGYSHQLDSRHVDQGYCRAQSRRRRAAGNPVGSDVAVGGSWAPVTALSGSGLVVATSGIGSPVSVRSAGLFGWMPRGSTLPWAVALDVNVDGTVIVTSQGVYRFGVRPS